MENVQVNEKEKEGEDRISSLPDCLIHVILSRLRSTKYAIRTGTLSKRWQHLWPSLSRLSFSYFSDFERHPSFDDDKPLPGFYLAVDKTLNQCQSNNLNRFKLITTYDESFEFHVSKWIQFVTSNNCIRLVLFLVCHEGPLYELKDDSFFVNSDFIYLRLLGCLLKPTKPITWNRLTTLIIEDVKVDHDLIENILSGSPSLVKLSFFDCYGYSCLDITSKSVERLVVSGYYDVKGEYCDLVINAPYISSLTIEGDLWLFLFSLRDVSSLVHAKLDYHMTGYHGNPHLRKEEEEILNRLILNLHKAKELEIGSSCYEVLARLEVRGFTFPSNLKGVDVTSHVYSLAHSKALVDCRDIDDSSDSDASDSDETDSDSVERGDFEEPVLCMFV